MKTTLFSTLTLPPGWTHIERFISGTDAGNLSVGITFSDGVSYEYGLTKYNFSGQYIPGAFVADFVLDEPDIMHKAGNKLFLFPFNPVSTVDRQLITNTSIDVFGSSGVYDLFLDISFVVDDSRQYYYLSRCNELYFDPEVNEIYYRSKDIGNLKKIKNKIDAFNIFNHGHRIKASNNFTYSGGSISTNLDKIDASSNDIFEFNNYLVSSKRNNNNKRILYQLDNPDSELINWFNDESRVIKGLGYIGSFMNGKPLVSYWSDDTINFYHDITTNIQGLSFDNTSSDNIHILKIMDDNNSAQVCGLRNKIFTIFGEMEISTSSSDITYQHNPTPTNKSFDSLLKLDDYFLLGISFDQEDSTNNILFESFEVINAIGSAPLNLLQEFFEKIKNIIRKYNNSLNIYSIKKVISFSDKSIAVLIHLQQEYYNLLVFHYNDEEKNMLFPINSNVGEWDMRKGKIKYVNNRILTIIEFVNDATVNATWKSIKINGSPASAENGNFDSSFSAGMTAFYYKYDKTIHNINHNYGHKSNVAVANQRAGLAPFRYPTIPELKNQFGFEFPDDFNYHNFLGNTFDTISWDEIYDNIEQNKPITSGSKLPEELKFFKNTINNSNIVEVIAYPLVCPSIQNGPTATHYPFLNENGIISINKGLTYFKLIDRGDLNISHPTLFSDVAHYRPIIILQSIGHSDKMNDNPFIWFESNAVGLIGIKENGEIFAVGGRATDLDHIANQSLWSGIFPHTLKSSGVDGITSFAKTALNTDWYREKLKTRQIGNYWPPEQP